MNKIFSSLECLGFNYEDDIELYTKKEEKYDEGTENKKETKIDINTLLYDKKITCPVCLKTFDCRVVKCYVPRVKSKDTDSFRRYEGVNPYFYEVLVCPTCGYAALKGDFHKIESYKREVILVKISNKWQGKEYPQIYDIEIAIERYKLALLNAVLGEFKDSKKAVLCLKIAWMYRLLEKQEDEKEFLERALQGFLIAYEKERTPIYGLSRYSLEYLIGELYRRIGDYINAKIWLGRVITGRADQKLKEKARDMRDLSKELELLTN
ncbi:DUF2225 domain-containing protein [Clostridium sp.]|uniref:DUF2225 domain-containing protein n=1 Tax=Clostridium sp. TaxID=1506 RepID=UPI003217F1F7